MTRTAKAPVLEIAANSLASALAAQAGGADRIELCENLENGGTTPSFGTLALVRERVDIPVYVLIRPRAGDFLYSADDVEIMRRDIAQCRALGFAGVVIGALDSRGRVDTTICAALMAEAGEMGVTYHRAFDASYDLAASLETIIALGCERVLTSGGHASALEGAAVIAQLRQQAGERIAVMAGAGVLASNASTLLARTGVREVHGSAKALRASAMEYRNAALVGLDYDWQQSEAAHVRALRMALDAAADSSAL